MWLRPFFLLKYSFRSASTYWALFQAKIDLQTPYIHIHIYIYIYYCYKKAIQSIRHYNGNTRLNYVNPRLTSLTCHLLNPKLFPVNLILTAYTRNHALFAARVSVRWFLYLTELNSTYSGLRIRLLERFKNVQLSRTRHAFAWLGFDDCMTWLWEAFR